ncbi:MAG: hypothetical protein A4E67_01093 [Syntrophaceae bacterium PtaB.Bin038]|nr:MAG: hypothetical protein A4E67_01093 [Syntrophaceae bacterium PtaB.Bin038]
MGDPAGHLAPRRDALRALELRDVFEDDDHAHVVVVVVEQHRRRHQQREGPVFEGDRDLLLHVPRLHAGDLREDLPHQIQMARLQHLLVAVVQDLLRLDVEKLFGGPVHRRDHPVAVDRHDPGGDVAQHRLHVLAALVKVEVDLLEFLLAHLQVPRHPVEGVHQDPDFVVGHDVDLVVQVPLGDRVGRLGQVLDRLRDALGQEEAEPRGREDDQQRHDEEDDDVARLDRVLEKLELLVLFRDPRDRRHLVDEPLGDVAVHHDGADDDRRAGCDVNGGDPADEVPETHGLHRRELPAGPDVLPELGRETQLGDVGVSRVFEDELLRLLVEEVDLDEAQLVDSLPLLHQGAQVLETVLFEQAVLGDVGAQLFGVVLHVLRGLLVVVLGQLEGEVQGAPDADVEPVVDAVGQEVGGH